MSLSTKNVSSAMLNLSHEDFGHFSGEKLDQSSTEKKYV